MLRKDRDCIFVLKASAQRQTVMDGIADIEANTCIRFTPRTSESAYIYYTQEELSGCFSYIGMIGIRQQINYPQWCLDQFGSVRHEMIHAIGFYHMQSDSDRDTYVEIHEEHIESGTRYILF